MIETLTFFKIRVNVKKERMKTETVFTKREMTNDWDVHFLQNSSFGIQNTYSSEFTINLVGQGVSFHVLFKF